jgi:hypothetical protein
VPLEDGWRKIKPKIHLSKRSVNNIDDELGTLLGVNLENWTRAWLDF